MSRARKNYPANFKAQVALAARRSAAQNLDNITQRVKQAQNNADGGAFMMSPNVLWLSSFESTNKSHPGQFRNPCVGRFQAIAVASLIIACFLLRNFL